MTIEEMKNRKKELGYSYETISELSGVPMPTVQKVLGGVTKSPRYETIRALEKVFTDNPPDQKRFILPGTESSAYPAQKESLRLNSGTLSPGVSDMHVCYGNYHYGNTAEKRPHYDDCYPLLPWKRQGEYTSEDRDMLPDDVRTELIDGVLYDMASPHFVHQIIVGELYSYLRRCTDISDSDCIPVISPSDVYLDRNDKTVVQPDIYVVCGFPPELTESGHSNGAPPFVIEVLSPSTRKKDMFLKTFKYSRAGVKEYWIVDPQKKAIIVYLFDDDPESTCDSTIYGFDSTIPVGISGGKCFIDFSVIAGQLKKMGL